MKLTSAHQNLLKKAMDLAIQVHGEQLDRYGQPYLLHVCRVASAMQTPMLRTAALLHDVVEDSDITVDDLVNEGFSTEIATIVDCLTKREGEPYDDYINRVVTSRAAITIKLADLEDNMDARRLPEMDNDSVQRYREKYLPAFKRLQALIEL